MNNTTSRFSKRSAPHRSVLILCTTFGVFLLGHSPNVCAQRTASAPYGTFLDELGIIVDGAFVPGVDATPEQLAANPPLFENHTPDHLPVRMPDGTTPVTYNDVANVSGTLTVVDAGELGTQVTVEVGGLIPDGLYTAWIDFYQSPGFTPDFANELAAGALGYNTNNPPANPNDYVGNLFTADANGRGGLDVLQPPGPTSWFTTGLVPGFEVPPYVLDAPVAEFHVVLAYHIDGNSWGPRPGAGEGFEAFDATWVGYAGTFVVPEPATLQVTGLGLLVLLSQRRTRRWLRRNGESLSLRETRAVLGQ